MYRKLLLIGVMRIEYFEWVTRLIIDDGNIVDRVNWSNEKIIRESLDCVSPLSLENCERG